MIQLTSEKPTVSGFYFVTFYNNYDTPSFLLEELIVKDDKVFAKYTKEIISLYEHAAYSVLLPNYIRPKFVKMVNARIDGWSQENFFNFSENIYEGFDKSFSVFVNINGVMEIFNQNFEGKVDTCSFYGVQSFSVMSDLLNNQPPIKRMQ